MNNPSGVKARSLMVVGAPLIIPTLSICFLAVVNIDAENFFSLGAAREIVVWGMLAINFANLLFALWFANKLGSYLSDRINRLADNVVRIQNEEKPIYIGERNDEFAVLDQAVEDLALEQSKALARERDLIENAGSIICSIDADFRVQTVNPAAHKLLGFSPEEIIGRNILQLCAAEDHEQLTETLYQVRYAAAEAMQEVSMPTAFRTTLMSNWMIKWSVEKNTWICVIQDITERKKAEAMRQQMVNMVSHDIRSPLSAIQLIFALLKSGEYASLSPKGIEVLSSGERNCMVLQNVTDNLLAIDRLEAKQVALDLDQIDVDEQFAAIALAFSATTSKRKISLEHPRTGLKVIADQPKLEQMLTNLVANAIKFSPDGGRILMQAMQTPTDLNLSVHDQGLGIPKEALPFIFDRYHQVKGAKSAERKGAGLGLAIVKALIELHGGSVTCASQEGVGSSFTLSFPVTVNR